MNSKNEKSSHLCAFGRAAASAIALCSALAAPAFAAEGAGSSGGGGSIVCFQRPETLAKVRAQGGELRDEDISQISEIEAYDLFQARLPRGMDSSATAIFPMQPGERNEAYVERLARRFDSTVPAISDLIRAGEKAMREGQTVRAPNGVAQLNDAAAVIGIDKSRCALVTTAHQYSDGHHLTVAFDDRLMKHPRNSPLSRAILVLHEAIYSIGRMRGHTTSRPTRDLISTIARQDLGMTAGQLAKVMVSLGFADTNDLITLNQRMVSSSENLLIQRARELLAHYDKHNSHVFQAMNSAFSAWKTRTTIETVAWVPGWIEMAIFNRCPTLDNEQCAVERIVDRFAYYFKGREQWIRKELYYGWSEARARLETTAGIDLRALRLVDKYLGTVNCDTDSSRTIEATDSLKSGLRLGCMSAPTPRNSVPTDTPATL